MAKVSREALLDDLTSVANNLGETPTARQIDEYGKWSSYTYRNRFGTWNGAIEAANLTVNQERATNKTVSDFIDDIQNVAEVVDRVPRRGDMDEYGNWNPTTYQERVPENGEKSRWSVVLKKAGFDPHWEEKDTHTFECEVCGEEREIKEYRKDRRFCSTACHGKWREGRFTGEDSWAYSKETVYCSSCGKSLKRRQCMLEKREHHFCSHDCYGDWLSENNVGPSHPRWKEGVTHYGKGWNEEKREKVRERDNRRCQACGKSEEMELVKHNRRLSVHHIIPASLFDSPEKRNAMDNLVSLCVDHHQVWEGVPLRPTLV